MNSFNHKDAFGATTDDLYDYLAAFSTMKFNEIYCYLEELSEDELVTFLEGLNDCVPFDEFDNDSVFNFSTDSILEGGPFPCKMFSCRERNVQQLAKFASLYADKVLIRFPVEQMLERASASYVSTEELAYALHITMRLESVVRAGYIGFTSDYIPLCDECLNKQLKAESRINDQLDDMWNAVVDEFCAETTCTLQKAPDGCLYVAINGMNAFGSDHEIDIDFVEIPHQYLDIYSLRGPSELSKEEILAGNLDVLLAPMFDDVFRALTNPVLRKGSYITRQTAQLNILNTILSNSEIVMGPQSLFEQIAVNVPFAPDASIRSIVEFRQANTESFELFRDAMNQGIKLYGSDRNAWKLLDKEVVKPEIHKLENSLKTSKRKLLTHSGIECAVGVTSLALTHFGVISLQDALAIMGVGGASSFIHSGIDYFNNEDIKGNPMYFLWKLNHLG